VRVALFVTCVNDALFPGTGRATVRLLKRLGVRVDFPQAQTCCGQLHYNSGYRRHAHRLAERFRRIFDRYEHIVAPSGSCVAMVRDVYPRLAPELADVAARTYELSEYVVDVLGVVDTGATFPHRVTYHPSCHSLRLLNVGDRPLRLLAAVRDLQLVDLPGREECCGFGGMFALKNAPVSTAMGADKARHAVGTGAEVLCASDNSCLMHIGGLLSRQSAPMRVQHLAEILATDGSGSP
jgi:L-lactate dehydrogenase complex protein LldE